MTDLTVRLVLAADGRALRTEIVGASQALDTFAQKAEASGVRVERTTVQAEQAVRRIGTTAVAAGAQVEAAMVGRASPALALLRQHMTQIGFQVQDVITQIQLGGNVWQAFAVQGGQLAGVIAGGIAGLVVQLGFMAAQMLFARDATEQTKAATLGYAEALRLSRELTGEAARDARELAEAKRQEAVERNRAALATAREAIAQIEAKIQTAEAVRALGRFDAASEQDQTDTFTALGQNIDRLRSQLAGLRTEAQEANVRLNEALQGRGQFGEGRGGGRGDGRTAAGRAVSEEIARRQRLRQEGEQLARQLDPQRRYNAEVERLNKLLRAGAIDQDTWYRGLARASEELGKAERAAAGAAGGVSGLDGAVEGLAREIAGTGKETAKMLADALLGIQRLEGGVLGLIARFASGVIERLIYEQITAPLAQAASVLLRSGLSSLLGLVSPAPITTGTPAQTNLGLRVVGGVHGGGIAGREATFHRAVPEALFATAPRLHSGGYIRPGEVPAILKRGEGVFTPEQMAALGGGDVVVNVIDQRGASAPAIETRERRGVDGRRVIDLVVKEAVNRGLADGSFDRAMQMSYGIARAGFR